MSKLRAIRKAAGLTQVQLSQRANVSRFRLCMAEADSLELRPHEVEAINKALIPEIEKAERIASEFRGDTWNKTKEMEQVKSLFAMSGQN